jgi:signal peptidase I
MSPAIKAQDLFLNMKGHPIKRWDLIGASVPRTNLFPFPELVKRVVGLPGETIELTSAGLMIDGRPVDPPRGVGPYLAVDVLNRALAKPDPRIAANGCWGRPITLGPDEYFLLGDNAAMSHDARFWPTIDGRQPGAMPARRITGRVAAIVWPPERWRLFE